MAFLLIQYFTVPDYPALYFTPTRRRLIRSEYDLWRKHYLPKTTASRDIRILDAGAGEGETIFFFTRMGYKDFIAVDVDCLATKRLQKNLPYLQANIEIRTKPFSSSDLAKVQFAKIDIEGAERELLTLKGRVPCEMVVEIHGRALLNAFKLRFRQHLILEKIVPDADGLYIVRISP